jgi:hypothetical protein
MSIKKQLAILLVLCGQNVLAQSSDDIMQTYSISGYRYWFDKTMSVYTGAHTNGIVTLDVKSLDEGFHTLHYQVVSSNGEVSPTRTAPIYRLSPSAEAFKSYTIKNVRYWFDKNYTPRETEYISGTSVIDVAYLDEGFHTLHYQVIDDNGEASSARTAPFFRLSATAEDFKNYSIKNVRYWFDKNYTPHETEYISGTSVIDVAYLDEGFHTLHYQVIDDNGEASSARTAPFFRLSATAEDFKNYTIKNVRYWFDKNYTPREADYIGGTSVIDVADIDEGFHTLHYQVIDDNGETSPARTVPFFRVSPSDEAFKGYTIEHIRYWFDKDYTPHESDYVSGTGVIDAASLEDGFHTLHYQVVDSKGETSPTRTLPFFRVAPIEEKFKDYNIQSVRYWVDQDETTASTSDYVGGVTTLDLSRTQEGSHTLYYQVVADNGEVSSARIAPFERYIYDIYVSTDTTYTNSTVSSNPLLASKPDLKLHYRTDDVAVRGHLTVDEGTTLSLGKYVQTGNVGRSNRSNPYTATGADHHHLTTLVNDGFMRADSVIIRQSLYRDRWHFISFPFNAYVSDITVPNGTYWALRKYDGVRRAAGDMSETWVNLGSNDMMEAGNGYIVQLTNDANDDETAELTFKAFNDTKKNKIFTTDDAEVTLNEYPAEFAHNRSWNLIGNPYPSFYDTRYMDVEGTIIVWNGNGYTAYSLNDDDYVLMPFEAFFMQKPLNSDAITFGKEGRQHTHIAQAQAQQLPWARVAANTSGRRLLNFTLSDGEHADKSRIVINEHASAEYEVGIDAAKFMETTPRIPQIYSEAAGVKYAINERPLGDGTATLSVCLPSDGDYTLSLEQPTANVVLLDTETNETVDLSDGAYTFTAKAGTYRSRFVLALTGNVSDIAPIADDATGMTIIGNALTFDFATPKAVKVYTTDGKAIYSQTITTDKITLPGGIYIVSVNDRITKVVVK